MKHLRYDHVLRFPPPARHPLVVVLALASIASGLGILVGGPRPGSAVQLLPAPMVFTWALGLVATGAAFIIAALWRDVVTGVLIEAAACVLGFLSTAAYVVGAITVLDRKSLVLPVLLTGAYGLGCLVRAWQIHRDISRARRILRERVAIREL